MANTKAALDVRIRAVFEEHGRASKEGGGKRLGAAELAAALDALGVRVNGQVTRERRDACRRCACPRVAGAEPVPGLSRQGCASSSQRSTQSEVVTSGNS